MTKYLGRVYLLVRELDFLFWVIVVSQKIKSVLVYTAWFFFTCAFAVITWPLRENLVLLVIDTIFVLSFLAMLLYAIYIDFFRKSPPSS